MIKLSLVLRLLPSRRQTLKLVLRNKINISRSRRHRLETLHHQHRRISNNTGVDISQCQNVNLNFLKSRADNPKVIINIGGSRFEVLQTSNTFKSFKSSCPESGEEKLKYLCLFQTYTNTVSLL